MKVLMVNKFLWPYGGAESYMFDSAQELAAAGHEVAYFGMDDPRNTETAHRRFHVSNVNYKTSGALYRLSHACRIVGKTVYSPESRRKMAAMLREFRPDVANLHIISHQISPSVLYALRDAGVPVVQSIHDYKLVCPNYSLFVRRTGEVCERCFGGRYYHCVSQRCMKGSLGASVLAAGAQYVHRALRVDENNIDLFLCSTKFLADKLVEGGAPADKVRHVPLTIDLAPFRPEPDCDDYIVYAGRILVEKGIATLIRAVAQVPHCRLLLVGEGEHRPQLEALATELGARNVEFLGFRPREELARIVARARFLVLPSELYETCGLVVWESYALERPVVAARIGGITENIEEGRTGLTFEPGNVEELAERVASLWDNLVLCREMGKRARARVEDVCAGHRDRLLAAYREAQDRHRTC